MSRSWKSGLWDVRMPPHRGTSSEFASHPSRNLAARPQPAIGRRVVKAQAQFSEQVGLQDRCRCAVATAQVAKSLGSLGIVAGEQLFDPSLAIGRRPRHLRDGVTTRNLTSVAPQRGWEALKAIGWSIQKPRPKNPKSATPEEAAVFKKSSRMPLPRRRQSTRANRSRSSPRTSIALA